MARQNIKKTLKYELKQEVNGFQRAKNKNDEEGRHNNQMFCATQIEATMHLNKKITRKGVEDFMNCDLTFLFLSN